MNDKSKQNKTGLRPVWAVGTCILAAALLVLVQLFTQNAGHPKICHSVLSSPLILLFNFIPLFLVISLFYFATGRLWTGFGITAALLGIGLAVNEYKILLRDEPFRPLDLTLGPEAVNIVQNYELPFSLKLIVMAAVLLVLFFVLFKLPCRRPPLALRISGSAAAVLVMAGCYFGIYQNTDLYQDIPTDAQIYYDVSVVSHKGWLYSFLTHLDTGSYNPPPGYSVAKARELLSVPTAAQPEQPPINVIAVMSEAFFDPQSSTNVEFYPNMNPLANFNELKEEGRYGTLIVPGFAGGTASTEFEFLTGASIPLISSAMPDVYKTHINGNIYALPRLFGERGYASVAIHPGHKWFYNRQNVYQRMGFQQFITEEDLPEDVEKVNYYISDAVTADVIIDRYAQHLADNPQQGYFNFTVTIQNHGPYMDEPTDRPPRLVRPEGMSDRHYYIVNNYMDGLYDADQLLGRLKDYLGTLSQPTVLLFFGDHLPYFDSEFLCYEQLGYDVGGDSEDSQLRQHSVPYLLWANESARALTGGEFSGDGGMISSNFLPLELLQFMNMPLPPYFQALRDVRDQTNVITSSYVVSDGELMHKYPETAKHSMLTYQMLQYYNLRDYQP